MHNSLNFSKAKNFKWFIINLMFCIVWYLVFVYLMLFKIDVKDFVFYCFVFIMSVISVVGTIQLFNLCRDEITEINLNHYEDLERYFINFPDLEYYLKGDIVTYSIYKKIINAYVIKLQEHSNHTSQNDLKRARLLINIRIQNRELKSFEDQI